MSKFKMPRYLLPTAWIARRWWESTISWQFSCHTCNTWVTWQPTHKHVAQVTQHATVETRHGHHGIALVMQSLYMTKNLTNMQLLFTF